MTVLRVLAALTVFALAPAAAQAHTTIIEPPESHFPYQQWVDEAKVPTPDVTLTVVEDSSGCEEEASACTGPESATIWLDPLVLQERAAVRETLLHELGHRVDYVMPEWMRLRFLSLRRDKRAWRAPPNSPNEQFAEAWRLCAERGLRIREPIDEGGYNYFPSPRLHGQVCRMVSRL